MARKVTTSVTEEEYRHVIQLKREGITVSDIIRIALVIHDENPELFYSIMYRLSRQKEAKKVRL